MITNVFKHNGILMTIAGLYLNYAGLYFNYAGLYLNYAGFYLNIAGLKEIFKPVFEDEKKNFFKF